MQKKKSVCVGFPVALEHISRSSYNEFILNCFFVSAGIAVFFFQFAFQNYLCNLRLAGKMKCTGFFKHI